MKKYLIALFVFAGLLTNAHAQTNAYSGNWKRNDTQTDPGHVTIESVPQSLKITADEKAIYVDATIKNDEGQVHHGMDTLKLDGSVNIFLTPGHTKKQTSMVWSADKGQFTARLIIVSAEGSTTQEWTQVYSIFNGGKSLKIAIDIQVSGQSAHLDEIFDKQ